LLHDQIKADATIADSDGAPFVDAQRERIGMKV